MTDGEVIKKQEEIIKKLKKKHERDFGKIPIITDGFGASCSKCKQGIKKTFKYCPYCGQKIKWEERNDDKDKVISSGKNENEVIS